MHNTILYLGMANDIMAPMLLVPDFRTIFAIDMSVFDPKKEIRTMLQDGHNKNSWSFEYYGIRMLNGPCEITLDEDSEDKWILEFIYDGSKRSLIYFHNLNYFCKWPDEITGIGHLMSMGAPSIALGYNDDGSGEEDAPRVSRERTVMETVERFRTPTFQYYALEFNHKWFPHKISLDGFSKIARIELHFLHELLNRNMER